MLLPATSPSDKLKIVIDTREQKGWTFNPKQVDVVRRALWAGDYSVVGLEREIAIERKSLGDFVQTVIHDWLRFRKELIRLSGYQLAVIAVEATVLQVEHHEYESEASPASVLGRANSIVVDHGIPVMWWGNRITAANLAHQMLLMAWGRYYASTLGRGV